MFAHNAWRLAALGGNSSILVKTQLKANGFHGRYHLGQDGFTSPGFSNYQNASAPGLQSTLSQFKTFRQV
jgi:hypothetical protein